MAGTLEFLEKLRICPGLQLFDCARRPFHLRIPLQQALLLKVRRAEESHELADDLVLLRSRRSYSQQRLQSCGLAIEITIFRLSSGRFQFVNSSKEIIELLAPLRCIL